MKSLLAYKITGLILLLAVNTMAQESFPPENFGGRWELNELIKQEMQYPDVAFSQKTEGIVNINFVTDEEGNVIEQKVTESPDTLLSEEALRIFAKILWNPGTYRGMPFEIEHDIEIAFKISKYKKMVKYREYDKLPYKYTPWDATNEVYDFVALEQSPQSLYHGSPVNFGAFIAQHLTYPETALKQSISGKVRLFFVIEPHGGVTNAFFINEVGAGCCEEALRLVRAVEWIPGKYNGIYVRTAMTVDVNFSLPEGTDYNYFPTYQNNAVE